MGKSLTTTDETLYERDFYAWTQEQAGKLRAKLHEDIDWENLAEEVESIGRRERKEIRSRLTLLIKHLLKWQFQPGRRCESWRVPIGEQRIWIPGSIETSPSLKTYPEQIFKEAYKLGRREAVHETGLPAKAIPVEPPFTVVQALDGGFWPGDAFAPWDVLRD